MIIHRPMNTDWQPHFCWLPTFTDDCLVWLDWVERKRWRGFYIYRMPA